MLLITFTLFELENFWHLQINFKGPLLFLFLIIPFILVSYTLINATSIMNSVLLGLKIGILAGIFYYISVWIYFLILQALNPEKHVAGDLPFRLLYTIFFVIIITIYSIFSMLISHFINIFKKSN